MSEGESESYPYFVNDHGINFDALKYGKSKYISAGGRELNVEKYPGLIRIKDGGYEMSAEVDDGILQKIRLFTENQATGEKHPDMYASRFLEAFLRDCEKQDIEISGFHAVWMNGSDTYAEYQKVLAETGDKVLAARANLMKPLIDRGIVNIEEKDIWENKYQLHPEDNTVHANFSKTSSEQIQKAA